MRHSRKACSVVDTEVVYNRVIIIDNVLLKNFTLKNDNNKYSCT